MKDIRFAKLVVFVNGAVPLALLLWDAFRHGLGANPVNFAIRTTGMLTLVCLFLSLLVTPVRKITGWNWLIFSRRTLGLYAFFYGCTHFFLFYGLDRSFSLASTFSEMLKRKYLFVGITGLLLMAPLAATSTNAMIKRLGAARWRALHRLVYLAAIAGVLHYYMLVKADVRQPLAFAAALALLLGFRLMLYWRRPKAPHVAGVVRPKMWSGPLRVERIVQETPDVQTFRLVSPDGGRLPFDYVAGQYLILSLLIAGKRVTRTYTIASSPARPACCELTIKREEHGLASGHLHDNVREGDLLGVSAPAGRFTFDETRATSVVLIAGGVGVTPLMAILRYLTDRNWKGDIHFLYCAKTARDIIFRQELDDLQRRFPNLHLVVTLTRVEGTDWAGQKGRITGELLAQTIPNLAAQPVFICGPASMMELTIELLRGQGVPSEQIRSEAFLVAKRSDASRPASDAEASPVVSGAMAVAPSPAMAIDELGPPAVTFSLSARSALLSQEKTLLELSEQAGLNIDYECRSGVCGRCKTKLLAGSVTMEVQDALDELDKANNFILLCQAKATDHVTIEA
jgi:ferredoxin-NADP reductase/DMSO/TMAO reductase YedYZ heme-binding membrane subunit